MSVKKQQRLAKARKQADNYDEVGIDPFSRAPAGYGLTQTPDKWPWDSPPTHTVLEDAFNDLKSRTLKSETRFDLLRLMDAGIPIETLVRTMTFGAFTEGLVNPDVAELLNVPLSAHLLVLARNAGITPRFNNNVKLDVLPQEDVLDIMRRLNPKRYNDYLNGTAFKNEEGEQSNKEQPKKDMGGFMAAMTKSKQEQEAVNGN